MLDEHRANWATPTHKINENLAQQVKKWYEAKKR